MTLLLLLVACGSPSTSAPSTSGGTPSAGTPSAGTSSPGTTSSGTSSAGTSSEGASSAWNADRDTQLHRYRVSLAFDPDPPPLGELFTVRATLTYPDGQPVEDAKVTLDATMPVHGHGMQTQPQQDPGTCDATGRCKHPGGVYTATGFEFHMPGTWNVSVDVNGPRGLDNTAFDYEMAAR